MLIGDFNIMTSLKKITFKTDEYGDNIIIDLDDFVWLITALWDVCNFVGCIPEMEHIEYSENILDTLYENKLNLYLNVDL